MVEIKHGGCWYCASTKDEFLSAMQKDIIDKQGSKTRQGAALCSGCAAAPVLDLRVPVEQRKAV